MKLPIMKVKLENSLKGQQNGKLNSSLLVPCGVQSFLMTPKAARAMRALVASAESAGFKVRATGTYRSYDRQVSLFQERYTRTELPGRATRTWNGVKYWQKYGVAAAATPGKSNHGLGLAIDFAEERDNDPQVESVSTNFVAWLCANAARFGYSAELQSEPWHWRYCAGDDLLPDVEGFYSVSPIVAAPIIEPPKSSFNRPMLKRGSRGDAVKEAQRLLTRNGHILVADGIFGRITETATKAFQRRRGLKADGIIGPKTWAALLS